MSQNTNSTPPLGSSQKVADWVGLFQSEGERKMMEPAKIGQYSCTKLLKDLEAPGVESGEDEVMDELGDDELVHLSENLCQRLIDARDNKDLSEDLYVIPEVILDSEVEAEKKLEVGKMKMGAKKKKEKWGPTLVEKRSSKGQHDGKTILDKAQERQKRTNLEGGAGISKTSNSFSVLSSSIISELANVVGISLGGDSKGIDFSSREMQEAGVIQTKLFEESCRTCQLGSSMDDVAALDETFKGLAEVNVEGVDPQTSGNVMIIPQLEECLDCLEQWTQVRKRKKNKPKHFDEMHVLEC
jgi:hypothetical protein